MATLHVRNVPDELYEALRDRADAVGASISDEVCSILSEALYPSRAPFRRRPSPGPLQRFTGASRGVVATAQREARELGHDHVGPEHILLGLAAAERSARVLEVLGLTPQRVRERIVELAGRGQAASGASTAFAPGAKKVLERALRESLALGHTHVGTEHLLLGMASERDSVAARILAEAGADEEAVRREATRALAHPAALQFSERVGGHVTEPTYRVVALTGSAEDWARQLNEPAGEGWELVRIAGEAGAQRAVFRRVGREVWP